ncbi:MAG: prefoldin subunit beta [Halobacteriales archaeon]
MQGNLPPEAQEKIEELRQLQGTAQELAIQKTTAESQLRETEQALEQLTEIDADTEMYQEVGQLLIETEYEAAQEELEERQANLERRVEALERQEQRVETQFESLQEELQGLLGGMGDLMGA